MSMIIGIAGGSGSGKSTFTNRLKEYFGDDISVLYQDNYYRNQNHLSMEKRMLTNYDHPSSLETDLMIEHLKLLKEGISVQSPVYDYTQHTRSSETIAVKARKVIIVEGILLLSDQRVRDLLDISIYIEADADERILRRILRDVGERGRDLEGIIEQYRSTVKPMHNQYVEPIRSTADIIINDARNDVARDLVACRIREYLLENRE